MLEADTCAETLDALRVAHGRIDLLLIDVAMPNCDGLAVGRHVLQQWPYQRILYMSAHTAEVLAEHGLSARNGPVLAKPYDRGEVLAQVKLALETRPLKRVLVVDDEAGVRSALSRILSAGGYDVIVAADGHEATRLWRERSPDLVIVDLFMPGKDGLETIVELRAFSPGTPIIAMSGAGKASQIDLLEHAAMLGAVATIEKPFEKQAIMDLVAHTLRP